MTDLGARILERISVLGINQTELARRVGITQPAVANLIKRGGGSSHLHTIAKALETSTEYLTGKTDDPESHTPDRHLTAEEERLLEKLRSLSKEDREMIQQLTRKLAGGTE